MMIKYITIVNWIVIAILGLLVGISILFPTKGGEAAGRVMSEAILMLSVIVLIALLVLNLIPFNWGKYTAFTLVLLPVAILLLSSVGSGVKDLVRAITYRQSEYDGSAYFPDRQRKAILAAIFDEDVAKVEDLLHEPVPQIDDLDSKGEQTILDYTATHYSPYTKNWKKTRRIMELLIAAKATINSTNPRRVSTHAASMLNATPEMLKFFLDHGANPNAKGENNVPILYEAIRSGGEDALKKVTLLLDRGADCMIISSYDRNTEGYSPLIFASAFGSWEVCLLLIQRGADPNYEAPDGTSVKTDIQLFESQYKDSQELSPAFDTLKKLVNMQVTK